MTTLPKFMGGALTLPGCARKTDFSKRKRSAAISNGGCDGRRSFGRSTRAHSELLAA